MLSFVEESQKITPIILNELANDSSHSYIVQHQRMCACSDSKLGQNVVLTTEDPFVFKCSSRSKDKKSLRRFATE